MAYVALPKRIEVAKRRRLQDFAMVFGAESFNFFKVPASESCAGGTADGVSSNTLSSQLLAIGG